MSSLDRFLGGSALSVAFKLVILCIAVGAVLTWLDVTPWDLIANARDALYDLFRRGRHVMGDLFSYLVVGAVVVVPIWLILRVVKSAPGRRG